MVVISRKDEHDIARLDCKKKEDFQADSNFKNFAAQFADAQPGMNVWFSQGFRQESNCCGNLSSLLGLKSFEGT